MHQRKVSEQLNPAGCSASGQVASVMASRYAACSPQLLAVMTGDRVRVIGMDAVDPDSVAAMLLPRAMAVATTAEMESNVGATLRRAKEEQVARLEQPVVTGSHGNWSAETFLLIGVSRDPNALTRKRGLHQAGTVHVRRSRAAP